MKNKSVRIESDGPQTSSVILITRTDPFKYHHHDDNYDHTCEVASSFQLMYQHHHHHHQGH